MKIFAILLALGATLWNPALVGLIWTEAELDALTGYAPSYLQLVGISVISAWLTYIPPGDHDIEAEATIGMVFGRTFMLAIGLGLLAVVS